MCVLETPNGTLRDHNRDESQTKAPPEVPSLLPRFIKAEANLLRLPLFALHTKGLKTLDGIECRGTRTCGGQSYEFRLQVTRNTATLYPGPLARAAHIAILSFTSDSGLPIENPVAFTWGQLCRRMDVSYSGKMIAILKQALTSTAALLIKSHYALFSKPGGTLIHTGNDTLHLYERASFVGSKLPDGTQADANYVWFADWYIQSLNAMFTAPLDYELWRSLDRRSPIASRLYEFLMLNFYSGIPVLPISYERLAQLLPVRPERYRSLARKQLDPAMSLLTSAGVIEGAIWADSKRGIGKLQFTRGLLLADSRVRPAALLHTREDDLATSIQVRELRGLKPPEWAIVSDFYRLWAGEERHRPTAKELAQARSVIDENGQTKAKALIPLVVKQLKANWPQAKTFGAALKYLPEAAGDYDREQRRIENERREGLAILTGAFWGGWVIWLRPRRERLRIRSSQED